MHRHKYTLALKVLKHHRVSRHTPESISHRPQAFIPDVGKYHHNRRITLFDGLFDSLGQYSAGRDAHHPPLTAGMVTARQPVDGLMHTAGFSARFQWKVEIHEYPEKCPLKSIITVGQFNQIVISAARTQSLLDKPVAKRRMYAEPSGMPV